MKRIFEDIINFMQNYRRSGTSTLIKKVAAENDCWIVVAKSEEKEEFGENAISLSELPKMGLLAKPILIDNHALLVIGETGLKTIQNLEAEIEQKDKFISDIEFLFDEFKMGNYINKKLVRNYGYRRPFKQK